jgi:hypothetical protein
MGREKRATQSRAQEMLDKTGRGNDMAPGTPAAAMVSPDLHDKPLTSTRKAIVQIVLLYLVPILVVILIGKVFLKL